MWICRHHEYRLCLVKNAWYIIGRPTDADEPRTYRVARFKTLQMLDQPADVPEDFNTSATPGLSSGAISAPFGGNPVISSQSVHRNGYTPSSAPSAKRGAGLIAYTLRVWKTDEFDFTEVGRIYHEYMPAMRAGEMSQQEMEKKVNLGLAQVTGNGKVPVANGKSGESLGRKMQRLRMIYSASGKVKQQIFTCELDGTRRKQLTFEGDNGRPGWSPDGKMITYAALRGRERWVGVMDADGANQKLLIHGAAPDWSPDGKRIAYATGGQIWVMNADGSENAQISHSATRKNNPSWSPDGKRMVFTIAPMRNTSAAPRPKLEVPGTPYITIDCGVRFCYGCGTARLARVVVPGMPHHVTQRGNRRQETFFCDDDYQTYLDLLDSGNYVWCPRDSPSPELRKTGANELR